MLEGRRAQILHLVAESYIHSAHPVASAFIAEQLNVSSATVRNEFSWLEAEGYLQQPHTSAGRIPTQRGYAHYASQFLPPAHLAYEKHQWLAKHLRGHHGDSLLQEIANVAADLSGYTVVVRLKGDEALHALEIHLSVVSSTRVLAVVVLENGLTRQLVVDLEPTPKDSILQDAETTLRQLTLPLKDLPTALTSIARHAEKDLSRTLLALAEAWHNLTPPRLFMQGLRNIFAEPEAANPDFIRRVVEVTEQPQAPYFSDRLSLSFDDVLANVIAQLPFGTSIATLMLIGPARMRYRESLEIAQGISHTVTHHASNLN